MRRTMAVLLVPFAAWAHEGHGSEGAHLHAWDMVSIVALLVAAYLVVTRTRK